MRRSRLGSARPRSIVDRDGRPAGAGNVCCWARVMAIQPTKPGNGSIEPRPANPDPRPEEASTTAPLEDPPLYPPDPNDPPPPKQPEPPAPDDPGAPDESIPDGPDPSPLDA
jgi:hypothetical protein